MKHIYDNKLIDQLVETHQVHLLFDTKDLTFQCLQYQKGDVLCSPLNPIGCLLFLISGAVQIYALHPDGWKMPVASISKAVGQMFGDMEFCSGKPTAFFVEATEETICLALSIQDYRERLYQDIRFLHTRIVVIRRGEQHLADLTTGGIVILSGKRHSGHCAQGHDKYE